MGKSHFKMASNKWKHLEVTSVGSSVWTMAHRVEGAYPKEEKKEGNS